MASYILIPRYPARPAFEALPWGYICVYGRVKCGRSTCHFPAQTRRDTCHTLYAQSISEAPISLCPIYRQCNNIIDSVNYMINSVHPGGEFNDYLEGCSSVWRINQESCHANWPGHGRSRATWLMMSWPRCDPSAIDLAGDLTVSISLSDFCRRHLQMRQN